MGWIKVPTSCASFHTVKQLATPIIEEVAGIERHVRRALRGLLGTRGGGVRGMGQEVPAVGPDSLLANSPTECKK